jgi:hypothetical protein
VTSGFEGLESSCAKQENARHLVLSRPILIQADKTLTTKGSITNPEGEKMPHLSTLMG